MTRWGLALSRAASLAVLVTLASLTATERPVAGELPLAPSLRDIKPHTADERLPGVVEHSGDWLAVEVAQSRAATTMRTVIVTLRRQASLPEASSLDSADRQRQLIERLQATAGSAQEPIRTLLEARRAEGRVSQIVPFWIFDGLALTATPEVIAEVKARPDVLRVTPDEITIVLTSARHGGAPQANLSAINAPALWSMGFFGQGVVVANMDTGVDISHPELASRWRGGDNSWFDPYGEHPGAPADRNGHGTSCMGIIVGGDASGTAIGVAPQAQWIAVRIFDDDGAATATAIHLGFQWLLDPDGDPRTADAPQVLSNSWDLGAPGCSIEFQLDSRALRAAGILPIFAAGNAGPGEATSVSPANNPEAFAVGAVDNSGRVYGYSSRGPSACDGGQAVYPSLVAPGVGVKTTDLHGFYDTFTGTSLSAPHVAGALALLLSAFPNLGVSEQEAVLTGTAVDRGDPGPDNIYGAGQLDVLAAYRLLAPQWQVSLPLLFGLPTASLRQYLPLVMGAAH